MKLTTTQRDALARAWFYYGNNGLAHTHGNHKFIQRLLDTGTDERSRYDVTPACLMAVESILNTP